MTRILVTRPLPAPVLEKARALFDIELREKNEPMSRAEMRAGLVLHDGMLPTLGDHFTAEVLADGPHRCKILANFGVGYNHIDIAAATRAGVAVTNTPGPVTDATADVAIMLMLMVCRRAGEGERLLRGGGWTGWNPTQMLGLHMSGKTVGIVGMGRIGQAIAHRAYHGFGMEVAYYNRSGKELTVPASRHENLEGLAAVVDILVVAVPGGAETRHLIDGTILAAMKPGAHLVNVARGDVVDEAALIKALENGEIAGAGLDVYENEPQVPAALTGMENVVLLPHLGTAAEEVRIEMGMMAVENLRAFFAGEALPNRVVV